MTREQTLTLASPNCQPYREAMIRGLFWGVVLALVAVGCGGSAAPSETITEAAEGGAAGAPVTVPEEAGSGATVAARQTQQEASGAARSTAEGGAAGEVEPAAGGAPEGDQPSAGAAQGGSAGTESPSGGSGGSVVAQAGQPSAGAPQGGGAGAPTGCACTSGECCAGCQVAPNGQLVDAHRLHTSSCGATTDNAPSQTISQEFGKLFCDGSSNEGTMWVITDHAVMACPSTFICIPAGTMTANFPPFPNPTCQKP